MDGLTYAVGLTKAGMLLSSNILGAGIGILILAASGYIVWWVLYGKD